MPGRVDSGGRPTQLRDVDLDRFFHPKAVAVVGASDTDGKPNTGISRQLRAWAERVGATLYPVNPGRDTVFGLRCYPSVTEIEADVDVAALLFGDPIAALGPVVEKKI